MQLSPHHPPTNGDPPVIPDSMALEVSAFQGAGAGFAQSIAGLTVEIEDEVVTGETQEEVLDEVCGVFALSRSLGCTLFELSCCGTAKSCLQLPIAAATCLWWRFCNACSVHTLFLLCRVRGAVRGTSRQSSRIG